MALNCSERLKQIKEISDDLKPIIADGYTKTKSFAAAFVFNNLFEECWKLMKELLYEYYGYSTESENLSGPRKVLSTAYECGLIESDRWIKIMLDRNASTHDYKSQNLEYYFQQIKTEYSLLVNEFISKAEDIISKM